MIIYLGLEGGRRGAFEWRSCERDSISSWPVRNTRMSPVKLC